MRTTKIIERSYPVRGERWRFRFTLATLTDTKLCVIDYWRRGLLEYRDAEAICDSLDRAARAAA